MRKPSLILLIVGMVVVSGAALVRADDAADCGQSIDLGRSIGGRSRIIATVRSGINRPLPVSPKPTAIEASPYGNKGDYDREIADETTAISLDPKLARAFANRGSAYENKEDYDRAIAELDRAIGLDPKLAVA